MDLLAHACYGATLCSRSGVAGGKTGLSGRRWYSDASVWWSVLFGLIPDMISMWLPFALFWFGDAHGNFFRWFDGAWLDVYRLSHSLLIALLVSAILFLVSRKHFICSLAWAVHIVCDAITHGSGKFRTMPLYPVTEWSIEGVPFWRSVWVAPVYWSVLLSLWLFIMIWLKKQRRRSPQAIVG